MQEDLTLDFLILEYFIQKKLYKTAELFKKEHSLPEIQPQNKPYSLLEEWFRGFNEIWCVRNGNVQNTPIVARIESVLLRLDHEKKRHVCLVPNTVPRSSAHNFEFPRSYSYEKFQNDLHKNFYWPENSSYGLDSQFDTNISPPKIYNDPQCKNQIPPYPGPPENYPHPIDTCFLKSSSRQNQRTDSQSHESFSKSLPNIESRTKNKPRDFEHQTKTNLSDVGKRDCVEQQSPLQPLSSRMTRTSSMGENRKPGQNMSRKQNNSKTQLHKLDLIGRPGDLNRHPANLQPPNISAQQFSKRDGYPGNSYYNDPDDNLSGSRGYGSSFTRRDQFVPHLSDFGTRSPIDSQNTSYSNQNNLSRGFQGIHDDPTFERNEAFRFDHNSNPYVIENYEYDHDLIEPLRDGNNIKSYFDKYNQESGTRKIISDQNIDSKLFSQFDENIQLQKKEYQLNSISFPQKGLSRSSSSKKSFTYQEVQADQSPEFDLDPYRDAFSNVKIPDNDFKRGTESDDKQHDAVKSNILSNTYSNSTSNSHGYSFNILDADSNKNEFSIHSESSSATFNAPNDYFPTESAFEEHDRRYSMFVGDAQGPREETFESQPLEKSGSLLIHNLNTHESLSHSISQSKKDDSNYPSAQKKDSVRNQKDNSFPLRLSQKEKTSPSQNQGSQRLNQLISLPCFSEYICCMTVSKAFGIVILGGDDGFLTLININSLSCIEKIQVDTVKIVSIRCLDTQNQIRMYVALKNLSVKILEYNVSANSTTFIEPVNNMILKSPITHMDISDFSLFTSDSDHNIVEWTHSGKFASCVKIHNLFSFCVYDKNHILCTDDSSLFIFNLETGEKSQTIYAENFAKILRKNTIIQKSSKNYFILQSSRSLTVFDEGLRILRQITLDDKFNDLAVLKDATFVLGGQDQLKFISNNGKDVTEHTTDTFTILDTYSSEDTELMIGASVNGTCKIWKM